MRSFLAMRACLAAVLCTAFAQAVGEYRTVDINDPDVVAASEGAFQILNAQSNSLLAHLSVQIVSAQTQVVAGRKYVLEIDAGLSSCRNDGAVHTFAACPVDVVRRYSLVVIDQAWMHPRYTLVSHEIADIDTIRGDGSGSNSGSGSGSGLGSGSGSAYGSPEQPAWITLAADDEDVVAATDAAIKELDAQSHSGFVMMRSGIVSVKVRASPGIAIRNQVQLEYEVVVDAGVSSCSKMSMIVKRPEICPVRAPQRYTLHITDQAWTTPRHHLISHSVMDIPTGTPTGTVATPAATPAPSNAETPSRPRGPCTGCSKKTAVDEGAKAAAQAAVDIFNAQQAASPTAMGAPRFQMVEVTEVVTQVVAGIKYQLTLLGGPATCPQQNPSTGEFDDAVLEAWLQKGMQEGTLNRYGDAPDMVYPGGSPLFNEASGEMMSLYSYLRQMHPDQPWSKMCTVKTQDVKQYHIDMVSAPWMDPPVRILSHDLDTMLASTNNDDDIPESVTNAPAPPVSSTGPVVTAVVTTPSNEANEWYLKFGVGLAVGCFVTFVLPIGVLLVLWACKLMSNAGSDGVTEEQGHMVTQQAATKEYQLVSLVQGDATKTADLV